MACLGEAAAAQGPRPADCTPLQRRRGLCSLPQQQWLSGGRGVKCCEVWRQEIQVSLLQWSQWGRGRGLCSESEVWADWGDLASSPAILASDDMIILECMLWKSFLAKLVNLYGFHSQILQDLRRWYATRWNLWWPKRANGCGMFLDLASDVFHSANVFFPRNNKFAKALSSLCPVHCSIPCQRCNLVMIYSIPEQNTAGKLPLYFCVLYPPWFLRLWLLHISPTLQLKYFSTSSIFKIGPKVLVAEKAAPLYGCSLDRDPVDAEGNILLPSQLHHK